MGLCCYAPGCRTGCVKDMRLCRLLGIKIPSLFSVPKDPELLQKWQIATRRKDRCFNRNDKLCELHFTEDCIERLFERNLYDGTVFKLERERIRLKPGSVPTIFSYLTENISSKPNKRKITSSRAKKSLKKKKSNIKNRKISSKKDNINVELDKTNVKTCIENDKMCFEEGPININKNKTDDIKGKDIRKNCDIEPVHVNLKHSYEKVLLHLNEIQKPDSLWTVESTPEFVMCAKWDSEYSCERKIIVSKDLSVKVLLRNVVVPMDVEICDIENLSILLKIVNDLEI